ncbi:hypothetical protein O181_013452 [Austropuccinia psidii MF-1]|uniref:60S acidic ribosomal protein P2 n=1 Tax=Austropuccinia psidii MF-1 TaxID=1389203 RepID=A0A9Q3BYC2_9BASI|nr:hypothetical protein [Austropuccinia psidii MF-1]
MRAARNLTRLARAAAAAGVSPCPPPSVASEFLGGHPSALPGKLSKHPSATFLDHLAAYLLLTQGGNQTPSAEDVKQLLGSVGIDADEERLAKLISELEGKSLADLIAEGSTKLASVPSGGGGGAAAAPAAGGAAAAEAPKEEAKKEEAKEESDDDMGFGLFDLAELKQFSAVDALIRLLHFCENVPLEDLQFCAFPATPYYGTTFFCLVRLVNFQQKLITSSEYKVYGDDCKLLFVGLRACAIISVNPFCSGF